MPTELKEFCEAIHPAATAEFMEGLTAAGSLAGAAARQIPRSAVKSFTISICRDRLDILSTEARDRWPEILAEMATDDRVDLLQEIPAELADQLVELLPKVRSTGNAYGCRPIRRIRPAR